MIHWSDENQPAKFIRDDELVDTLYALARANRGTTNGYQAALLDIAAAYGRDRQLARRLAEIAAPVRVIEGRQ